MVTALVTGSIVYATCGYSVQMWTTKLVENKSEAAGDLEIERPWIAHFAMLEYGLIAMTSGLAYRFKVWRVVPQTMIGTIAVSACSFIVWTRYDDECKAGPADAGGGIAVFLPSGIMTFLISFMAEPTQASTHRANDMVMVATVLVRCVGWISLVGIGNDLHGRNNAPSASYLLNALSVAVSSAIFTWFLTTSFSLRVRLLDRVTYLARGRGYLCKGLADALVRCCKGKTGTTRLWESHAETRAVRQDQLRSVSGNVAPRLRPAVEKQVKSCKCVMSELGSLHSALEQLQSTYLHSPPLHRSAPPPGRQHPLCPGSIARVCLSVWHAAGALWRWVSSACCRSCTATATSIATAPEAEVAQEMYHVLPGGDENVASDVRIVVEQIRYERLLQEAELLMHPAVIGRSVALWKEEIMGCAAPS